MSDKRDPAARGRDMDAEAVASRSGVPIEQAKDVVKKTDDRADHVKDGTSNANPPSSERRER